MTAADIASRDIPEQLIGELSSATISGLAADIGAGKIDVVVVYKVDRLTRSLADSS